MFVYTVAECRASSVITVALGYGVDRRLGVEFSAGCLRLSRLALAAGSRPRCCVLTVDSFRSAMVGSKCR